MKKITKTLYLFNYLGACFLIFSFLTLSVTSTFPASSPQVWNLSDENPIFIGRKRQLQTAHTFFTSGKEHILALTGGPGFGKTQIAKEYAQQLSEEYDLIWWFDAGQDLSSQFERLAVGLNQLLPEQEKIIPSQLSKELLIDTVKNLLRIKNIKYLLIFDNPNTYTQIRNFIPCTHNKPKRHILITSRNASIWIHKIVIDKFERQESLQFIQKTLPEEKKEDMIRLAEAFSDYPLGLTLAVEFIDSHPTITISKYLAMHMSRMLKKRERNSSPLLDQYPQTVLSALEMSLDAVEEKSKDSLQALFFICLLNSKDIPESYIDMWLKKASSPLTADEAIKHIYDQSLIGVSETTEFAASKKQKIKEKAKERKKAIEKAYFLSMHDLVHQMINEEMPMKEKKELIAKATEVMLEVFSGSAEDITKKITNEPIHLLHAQKLCANAKEIGYVSDRLLQLKVCMLQCIMTVFRDFDAAQPLLEDIDNDLNAGLPLAPYYEALLKANKGFLAHNQANHDLAIQFMNESLAILEPYNEHDEEKLRAITNLIQYRAMRGEWVKTENLIENGRKIFKNLSCYSCQCFFIYAWAMVLNDQGKFQQALNVLGEESAYPMLSIEYPPIYQGIVLQKIESLIKLGRFDEANTHAKELKRKLEEFYAKKTAVLGYMLTLKSMSFLRHKNKRPQAFDMINEAIEIYNTSFQGSIKHRAQGRSHLALGKAYATQKDFPNALKAYRMSEHIYNTVLENKKIDDVSELYTDLAILGARMKDEALVHEYLKNHIQIFGRTHPRTKEILLFLSQNGLAVPL